MSITMWINGILAIVFAFVGCGVLILLPFIYPESGLIGWGACSGGAGFGLLFSTKFIPIFLKEARG